MPEAAEVVNTAQEEEAEDALAGVSSSCVTKYMLTASGASEMPLAIACRAAITAPARARCSWMLLTLQGEVARMVSRLFRLFPVSNYG